MPPNKPQPRVQELVGTAGQAWHVEVPADGLEPRAPVPSRDAWTRYREVSHLACTVG